MNLEQLRNLSLAEKVALGKQWAQERHAQLTPEVRQQMHMMTVVGRHRLECGTSVKHDMENWREVEALRPALLSDECTCRGMGLGYIGPFGRENLLTGELIEDDTAA